MVLAAQGRATLRRSAVWTGDLSGSCWCFDINLHASDSTQSLGACATGYARSAGGVAVSCGWSVGDDAASSVGTLVDNGMALEVNMMEWLESTEVLHP